MAKSATVKKIETVEEDFVSTTVNMQLLSEIALGKVRYGIITLDGNPASVLVDEIGLRIA